VVIASAVATVDEASGGRSFVVLGLGGYSCLKPLGMKIWERPLATLRETVKIIKGLYSGGSVEFDGEMFSPKGVKLEFAARKDIPVYIACMAGGRVLQLAGEVADGVLLAGPYGKYTKDIIEEVRKSADRNGRDPKILEIIMNTLLWCSTDGKKAIDEIKPFIAQEIVLDPRLHRAVEAEDVDVEKVRQAIQKGESGADLITDEVADAFAVVGDSDHCIERIKELGELGVAQINFWFPWTLAKYQTVTDRMKLVGKYIIPAFK
jgi:5,10-methylenetetrahydromethanopterin reductase